MSGAEPSRRRRCFPPPAAILRFTIWRPKLPLIILYSNMLPSRVLPDEFGTCVKQLNAFCFVQARWLINPAAKFWSYKTEIRYYVPLHCLFNIKYSVNDEQMKVCALTKRRKGLTGRGTNHRYSHMHKCVIVPRCFSGRCEPSEGAPVVFTQAAGLEMVSGSQKG